MSMMSGLGSKVSGKPKVTIVIILVLTMIFTYFGSSFENDADPEAFNPDHELIKASEEAGELFGTEEYGVSVIVRANDHNLLEIEDMKTLIELEDTVRNDEEIAAAIVPTQTNPTGFASVADMLVFSYGLLYVRGEMDNNLTAMNQSLFELAALLENPAIPNATKTNALMGNLTSLSENLTYMQAMREGSDDGIPEFNMSLSIATLDAISLTYGPDPVPSYLAALQQHDAEIASIQISNFVTSINSLIYRIETYLELLQGMPINPENGTTILMGLQFALPSIQAGVMSLDETIEVMYIGASTTLTRDFSEGDGTSAKGTIISINFNVSLEKEERSIIENRLNTLVKEEDGQLKYGVFGQELINEEIQSTMDFSQMLLMFLVIILIVLILFLTFRKIFDTVLTIISLVMAIMWTYGISIIMGLQGSIIAQVVPILLVGLGVDYGIHMIMRFREEKGKGRKNPRAISIAIATVGMALLLATVTTSIGFMSNTVSSLSVLREFAIMVTIGIVSSFIIMTTFLPAVKLVVSDWRDRSKKKKKKMESKVAKMKNNSKNHAVSIVTIGAKVGDKAPWAVLILLAIISGAAFYGASQLDSVFDFRDFLPVDTEAYDNYVYMMDEFQFGEKENGNFFIKGDITQPIVLMAINETINRTMDDEQVLTGFPATSILSVMNSYTNPTSPQDFNQSFFENWTISDTDGDGIPDENIKTLFDILGPVAKVKLGSYKMMRPAS